MAIHHAQIKSAESMGYTLEEKGDLVRAFMPSTAQQVFGVSAKDAMNQMIAFQNILKRDDQLRFRHIEGLPLTHGYLYNADKEVHTTQTGTPVELYRSYGDLEWTPFGADGDETDMEDDMPETGAVVDTAENIEDTFDEKPVVTDKTPPVKRSEKGVALDGAIAYREGVTAADCPFDSETDDEEEYQRFVQWNEDWDAAADAASDEEEGKTGSVVKSKYRTKYKEEGHPNHCGDELAEILNNYCLGDKATDLETFENICALNGVDTSKYNRTSPGWQGRIRMTGRNLLAKKVWAAGGVIVCPSVDGTIEHRLSSQWMSAQRFGGKNSQ